MNKIHFIYKYELQSAQTAIVNFFCSHNWTSLKGHAQVENHKKIGDFILAS